MPAFRKKTGLSWPPTLAGIVVIFKYTGRGVDIYRDEVRAKRLFELMDAFINSMRLQVYGPTRTEWDKVKATCPDTSLTDTFGELPWPLFNEKPCKTPKETDITPSNALSLVVHKQ